MNRTVMQYRVKLEKSLDIYVITEDGVARELYDRFINRHFEDEEWRDCTSPQPEKIHVSALASHENIVEALQKFRASENPIYRVNDDGELIFLHEDEIDQEIVNEKVLRGRQWDLKKVPEKDDKVREVFYKNNGRLEAKRNGNNGIYNCQVRCPFVDGVCGDICVMYQERGATGDKFVYCLAVKEILGKLWEEGE